VLLVYVFWEFKKQGSNKRGWILLGFFALLLVLLTLQTRTRALDKFVYNFDALSNNPAAVVGNNLFHLSFMSRILFLALFLASTAFIIVLFLAKHFSPLIQGLFLAITTLFFSGTTDYVYRFHLTATPFLLVLFWCSLHQTLKWWSSRK